MTYSKAGPCQLPRSRCNHRKGRRKHARTEAKRRVDVNRQQVSVVMLGVPSFSICYASHWAVEGFTGAVSKEAKPECETKFTIVEPGVFKSV